MWTWDFIADATVRGGALRMLTILNEYTRECHVLRADRTLRASDVLVWLGKAIEVHGAPAYLRSDNHGIKEYVVGDTHVNGLENFWKRLKGSIRSTHVHVSQKHLHKYAKEFEYRFNSREHPAEMFPALVSQFPKPQP